MQIYDEFAGYILKKKKSMKSKAQKVFNFKYTMNTLLYNFQTHRNVSCIAISIQEVFSSAYSRRIMIAKRKFEKNDFVPGMILDVDLYYCPVNQCHIAFDYTLTDAIIPTRSIKGGYQVCIFFLRKIFYSIVRERKKKKVRKVE